MTEHYRWETTLDQRRRVDQGIDDPARRVAARDIRNARDIGYHVASRTTGNPDRLRSEQGGPQWRIHCSASTWRIWPRGCAWKGWWRAGRSRS